MKICVIIRCLVLGQSTEFKVTSFKFKRSDISAVAFDFGLWTSDIGLTKTIQLLNYLTIFLCVLCVSVAIIGGLFPFSSFHTLSGTATFPSWEYSQ